MNSFLRCLLLIASCVLHAQAVPQDEEKRVNKEVPPRTLRILPLGEAPPFEQQVIGDVRYELEPPVGSIPPRDVSLTVGKLTIPSLRLSIGRISLPVNLPNGIEPVALRRPEDSPTGPPWLSLTLPETGNVLILLWRDPGNKWDKARWLLLPDGPEFGAGMLRLTNLSPVEVRFNIGEEKIALAPAKTHTLQVPIGKDVPVRIVWIDAAGNGQRVYSSALVQNEGERGELIIYRADGEQPRQPLKVLPLRERAPEPPPKPN